MKTKKKLDLKNGYANDPICGICQYCSLLCLIGGGGVLSFTSTWSSLVSYTEET